MGELMVIALISFACGVFALIYAGKTQGHARRQVAFIGFCLCAPLLFAVIGYATRSEGIVALGFFTAVGILLFGLGGFDLDKYKKCTLPIRAKCSDCRRIHVRGGTMYAPVFSYSYIGKTYVSHGRGVSRRTFEKLYGSEKWVSLHIDPKHPSDCYDKRRFPVSDVFLLIIGAVLLLLSVYIAVGLAMETASVGL